MSATQQSGPGEPTLGELVHDLSEQTSALVLSPVQLPARAYRFRVDGELSGTYKLLRDMQATLGVDIHPERIEIPYPEPPEARAYETHFRCPVTFGAGSDVRALIRNDHLHLRFPTADAAAHDARGPAPQET